MAMGIKKKKAEALVERKATPTIVIILRNTLTFDTINWPLTNCGLVATLVQYVVSPTGEASANNRPLLLFGRYAA